jgi:alkanesulfonate monooxygenase SsuD/methylene tetrahydromethanopterin reductase-like flavin-dependent oxidoreductase (luciferase family)
MSSLKDGHRHASIPAEPRGFHNGLGPKGTEDGIWPLHNLLEEIELADELDLDVFGVGEHHRPDYAV